jgi:hypothetical protein
MALEKEQIKTICIDTLTSIQENEMSAAAKKPGFDEWYDWGVGIHHFQTQLQELGFTNILIIGEPGVGKSSGMKTLDSNSNVWYNADNKNPTWLGGSKEYGKKTEPIPPFHIIPKSYDTIIAHIKALKEKGYLAKDPIAFITGHAESYKLGKEARTRLKTLGKLANKMQIEGKLEIVLYAKAIKENGPVEYILETQNDGSNTARSNEGMLPEVMPNDYKVIRDAVAAY